MRAADARSAGRGWRVPHRVGAMWTRGPGGGRPIGSIGSTGPLEICGLGDERFDPLASKWPPRSRKVRHLYLLAQSGCQPDPGQSGCAGWARTPVIWCRFPPGGRLGCLPRLSGDGPKHACNRRQQEEGSVRWRDKRRYPPSAAAVARDAYVAGAQDRTWSRKIKQEKRESSLARRPETSEVQPDCPRGVQVPIASQMDPTLHPGRPQESPSQLPGAYPSPTSRCCSPRGLRITSAVFRRM